MTPHRARRRNGRAARGASLHVSCGSPELASDPPLYAAFSLGSIMGVALAQRRSAGVTTEAQEVLEGEAEGCTHLAEGPMRQAQGLETTGETFRQSLRDE